MSRRAFSSLAILMYVAVADAQEIEGTADRTDFYDLPLVTVEAAPLDPQSVGVERQAEIVLTVVPRADLGEAILEIAMGGVLTGDLTEPFQALDVGTGVYPDLGMTGRYRRNLGSLSAGEPVAVSVPVRVSENGRGYIGASVLPVRGNPVVFAEGTLLHVLVDGANVYTGQGSFQALEEQRLLSLESQSRAHGLEALGEGGVDELIEGLRKGGARSVIRGPDDSGEEETRSPSDAPVPGIVPLQDGFPGPRSDADGSDPSEGITVSGRILFTDAQNAAHPVTFATVALFDAEPGPDRELGTAITDSTGAYRFTVPNIDSDGTGLDVYIVARTAGETVSVVRFDNGAIHEIASTLTADVTNLPNGAEIEIELVAGNDLGDPNNVAFEVYEAVNKMSRFLEALNEEHPRSVTIRFPRTPGDGSDYLNDVIRLALTDAHDWDNIMHEYGHHLQNAFELANSPGGQHAIGENLCVRLGKLNGIRLAWGEAWPTYFSLVAQFEGGMAELGIPNVGDTFYTDSKPTGSALQYDLEAGIPGVKGAGEGDELAIQIALWDFYDDSADDDLKLSPLDMWQAGTSASPQHFAEFFTALASIALGQDTVKLGGVLAEQNLGPRPVAPDVSAAVDGEEIPSFEWEENLGCAQPGQARHALRLVERDTGNLVHQTGFAAGTSFVPNETQLAEMFAAQSTDLLWLIVSRDLTAPQTGDYIGASRHIVDAFDPPFAVAEPQTPAVALARETLVTAESLRARSSFGPSVETSNIIIEED